MARPTPALPDREEILEIVAPFGVERIGFASATPDEHTRAALEDRIERGYSDTMGFTFGNPSRSTDPGRTVDGAVTVIAAARSYAVADEPAPVRPAARVARYARTDHYTPLRQGLQAVVRRLRSAGERAVVMVDHNGLVDRAMAHRAGLGWFGRNANLMLPGAGSMFVLGAVITTARYPHDTPVADGCGTCRRCIDGCPTGAIVEAGVVDARRCLAWLVQRPGDFPEEFRAALGDRIYGCDDCQEVCPPTTHLSIRSPSPASDGDMWVDLIDMLDADDATLLDRYGRWYIADRDPRWLRRNALICVGNTASPTDIEARAVVERYRDGDDDLLAEHARWALAQIASR